MADNHPPADTALWAILAEIDPDSEARYLAWFHGVHVPEKLSRPGYLWAAHYRMQRGMSGDVFLALFGGVDTRTFLDPTPAQLKVRQDAPTREALTSRVRQQSLVLAREWRTSASDGAAGEPAPFVAFTLLDAQIGDETLGASLIQQALPRWREAPGFRSATKYLAAVGSVHHVVHVGFSDERALAAHAPPPGETHRGRRIA
jgi:hypothetical protein